MSTDTLAGFRFRLRPYKKRAYQSQAHTMVTDGNYGRRYRGYPHVPRTAVLDAAKAHGERVRGGWPSSWMYAHSDGRWWTMGETNFEALVKIEQTARCRVHAAPYVLPDDTPDARSREAK